MQHFSEIDDIFAIAESKIKKIEHLGEGLTAPAVNQLRYVSCHLLRFDRAKTEVIRQEELRKAKNHCERAIYDAVEVGIISCLERFKKFQYDYRKILIPGIIPNYIDICDMANEAKEFISKITKDSTEDHCNNRGDHYEKCSEYFDKLDREVNKLNLARLELNKKMNDERRKFKYTIIGFLLTSAIIIIGIATLIIRCHN